MHEKVLNVRAEGALCSPGCFLGAVIPVHVRGQVPAGLVSAQRVDLPNLVPHVVPPPQPVGVRGLLVDAEALVRGGGGGGAGHGEEGVVGLGTADLPPLPGLETDLTAAVAPLVLTQDAAGAGGGRHQARAEVAQAPGARLGRGMSVLVKILTSGWATLIG